MNAAYQHFDVLPLEQKREAMMRLRISGASEYAISQATGIAVEQVRRILDENKMEAAAMSGI